MSEWQPIETAPKDGRYVLACVTDGSMFKPPVALVQWNKYGEHWEDEQGWVLTATHWMPVPELP